MHWDNNKLEGTQKGLKILLGKRTLQDTPEMKVCRSHTQILPGIGQGHLNHLHTVCLLGMVLVLLSLKYSKIQMGK